MVIIATYNSFFNSGKFYSFNTKFHEAQLKFAMTMHLITVFGEMSLKKPYRFKDFVKLHNLRLLKDKWKRERKNKLIRENNIEQINFDTFKFILGDVSKRVKSWGGKLCFIYLPHHQRFNGPQDPHKDKVFEIINELKISNFDMYKVFLKNDPESLFIFGLDNHYNTKGYELIVKTLIGG